MGGSSKSTYGANNIRVVQSNFQLFQKGISFLAPSVNELVVEEPGNQNDREDINIICLIV